MERTSRLAAASLFAVVVLTGCAGPADGAGASPVASVDAATSPEDVVRGYLVALQDGDEATAVSLTTVPYSDRDPWAADPPTLEDVDVLEHLPDPSGHAATGHPQSVWVPVSFTVHGAGDPAQDGPTSWGYRVVRDTDADVWKIADAGF